MNQRFLMVSWCRDHRKWSRGGDPVWQKSSSPWSLTELEVPSLTNGCSLTLLYVSTLLRAAVSRPACALPYPANLSFCCNAMVILFLVLLNFQIFYRFLRPHPKKNMVYGTLRRVGYNLTLCRLQRIYHRQPYARVDFTPQSGTYDLRFALCGLNPSHIFPCLSLNQNLLPHKNCHNKLKLHWLFLASICLKGLHKNAPQPKPLQKSLFG
jgi:hypothetical protein